MRNRYSAVNLEMWGLPEMFLFARPHCSFVNDVRLGKGRSDGRIV